MIDQIGGWFGFATSAVAYWLAAAEMFNDIIGEGKQEIIPPGPFKWNQYGAHGGMHAPGRIQAAHLLHQQSIPRDLFASARNLLHLQKHQVVGDTRSTDSIPSEENNGLQQIDLEEGSGSGGTGY
jgi:hypothetical protein